MINCVGLLGMKFMVLHLVKTNILYVLWEIGTMKNLRFLLCFQKEDMAIK